jgi:hypothetical protein
MAGSDPPTSPRWPLERILFVIAGSVVLLAAALAAAVSPWFLLLAVAVGLNQLLFAAVGACPASIVLSRACGVRCAGER